MIKCNYLKISIFDVFFFTPTNTIKLGKKFTTFSNVPFFQLKYRVMVKMLALFCTLFKSVQLVGVGASTLVTESSRQTGCRILQLQNPHKQGHLVKREYWLRPNHYELHKQMCFFYQVSCEIL